MDIQGHRGCRGLLPENSIPAFKKAIDIGVSTLELDVVISKDKKVVVSHEPYMNHEIALKPNGDEISIENEKEFNLYQMAYDSIKAYDCGSKVHPRFPQQKKMMVYKPLLSEMIQISEKQSNQAINYNVEIKSHPDYDGVYTPEVSEFVKLVLEVIVSEGVEERTSLQSFDLRALEEIYKQNPKIITAILIDENEKISDKVSKLSFKPEIISPFFALLNEENVAKFQKEDFKIVPWTVNKPEDIQAMLELKVDGIISDYPDLVISKVIEY
ncbi:MAG: glycerophosphodiester phosphodiesterase [Bacteroidota bacterium]